jgi:hypothetical protein
MTTPLPRIIPREDQLVAFVRASNRIEDIDAHPGEPEFDDHLDAARRVAAGTIGDPMEIHFVLANRLMPGSAGIARRGLPQIHGWFPPDPGAHLAAHIRRLRAMMVEGPAAGEPVAVFAWRIHHEFECVHPFSDGNGRTGRLLLNAIRLAGGLPWLTIEFADRHTYHALIRRYGRSTFSCHGKPPDYDGCETTE